MPKMTLSRSLEALETEAFELIENGVILHPDLPASQLAEILADEADPQFYTELARLLVLRHLRRGIKAERAKHRQPVETPPLFEGLDHLPQRITVNGKRHAFATSTITELRAYIKTLNKRHQERIAEIQAVIDLMEKYSKTRRKLTVRKVAEFEAES